MILKIFSDSDSSLQTSWDANLIWPRGLKRGHKRRTVTAAAEEQIWTRSPWLAQLSRNATRRPTLPAAAAEYPLVTSHRWVVTLQRRQCATLSQSPPKYRPPHLVRTPCNNSSSRTTTSISHSQSILNLR